MEPQFEDGGSYSSRFNNDALTFKQIILQFLNKISSFASVEFRGGYWEEKIIILGNGNTTSKVYIPDTREQYSNAVECFADMLFPHFDKEMIKIESDLDKEKISTYEANTILSTDKQRTYKTSEDKVNYRDSKRLINRKLFRALCSFLYRKRYLELNQVED